MLMTVGGLRPRVIPLIDNANLPLMDKISRGHPYRVCMDSDIGVGTWVMRVAPLSKGIEHRYMTVLSVAEQILMNMSISSEAAVGDVSHCLFLWNLCK